MKHLVFLLVCISTLTASSQPFKSSYKPGTHLTVHAVGGLALRSKPDTQSKVLTVVPIGEKVEVIPEFNNNPQLADTKSGIPGHWVNVKYKAMQGYQFDGFLSRFPVFNAVDANEPLYEPGGAIGNYLKSIYEVSTEATKQPASEQGEYRIWNVIDFKNGIHFEEKSSGSYSIHITFPQKAFSFHEAFLLGREVWPWLFGADSCPYNDTRVLCENAAPQYLSIQRDGANVNFDWYVSD